MDAYNPGDMEKLVIAKLYNIPGYSSVSNSSYSIQQSTKIDPEKNNQSAQNPNVEVVIPEIFSSKGSFSGIWSRKLRIKITGRDGFERLDVRVPVSSMFSFHKISYEYVSILLLCTLVPIKLEKSMVDCFTYIKSLELTLHKNESRKM